MSEEMVVVEFTFFRVQSELGIWLSDNEGTRERGQGVVHLM
jgi:hypothetical protein